MAEKLMSNEDSAFEKMLFYAIGHLAITPIATMVFVGIAPKIALPFLFYMVFVGSWLHQIIVYKFALNYYKNCDRMEIERLGLADFFGDPDHHEVDLSPPKWALPLLKATDSGNEPDLRT